jgi:2'-deoxynucleoside 5'-phosphate N-hydrolase
MQIFVAGAVTGGRPQIDALRHIVTAIQDSGHEPVNTHIAKQNIAAYQHGMDAVCIWAKARAVLKEAAAVIAEVSTPSTGLGYELCLAAEMLGKPVLCLYKADTEISPVISGTQVATLRLAPWQNGTEIEKACQTFLRETCHA